MSPGEIQRFEKEILGGQAVPPDLRALLDVAVSAGDGDPLREALGFALLVPGRNLIARLFGIAVIVFGLGVSEVFAADNAWKGAWKFEMTHQGQPWLGYHDPEGKTVFLIGCGTHFEVLAVYPATPKQDGRQSATITIASGKKQMDFAGFVDVGSERTPPDVKMFDQADLGNPDLDEEKWRALEYRVLDLFSSGQSLTISAEGKSYVLPPVKEPRWRARWQKIC